MAYERSKHALRAATRSYQSTEHCLTNRKWFRTVMDGNLSPVVKVVVIDGTLCHRGQWRKGIDGRESEGKGRFSERTTVRPDEHIAILQNEEVNERRVQNLLRILLSMHQMVRRRVASTESRHVPHLHLLPEILDNGGNHRI